MGKGKDNLTETEFKNLTTALKVYKEKGGNMCYFTVGAGAPGECILC